MCNDDDDDDDDDGGDDDDYDRDETQCMLVHRYASQRLSSQNNSWILAEPRILQMRLHADASCLFLITFF